jgi:hypothetical protein
LRRRQVRRWRGPATRASSRWQARPLEDAAQDQSGAARLATAPTLCANEMRRSFRTLESANQIPGRCPGLVSVARFGQEPSDPPDPRAPLGPRPPTSDATCCLPSGREAGACCGHGRWQSPCTTRRHCDDS